MTLVTESWDGGPWVLPGRDALITVEDSVALVSFVMKPALPDEHKGGQGRSKETLGLGRGCASGMLGGAAGLHGMEAVG